MYGVAHVQRGPFRAWHISHGPYRAWHIQGVAYTAARCHSHESSLDINC